jgi:leader peptidase (prepilin peptidase)/N-methyltransferase
MPIINGLIKKFIKEEELLEEYEKEHEEELAQKLTKEQKHLHKEAVKTLKAKYAPESSVSKFLLLAVLICVLYFMVGLSYQFFIYAFLTIVLFISFFTDLKICIIPDETNYLAIAIGIIYVVIMFFVDRQVGIDLLIGGIGAFVVFLLIAGISFLIMKKVGMGGGDTKLVCAIGFLMGAKNFVQIFVLSFFIAAIVSAILLIAKKKARDDYIPFGPFICIGTYITMLVPLVTLPMWVNYLFVGL